MSRLEVEDVTSCLSWQVNGCSGKDLQIMT